MRRKAKFFFYLILIIFLSGVAQGEEKAEDHNRKGLDYYREKNYEEAITEFKKAIELDANYAPAYYNLGLLYSEEDVHRRQEAIEEFKKVIDLNPQDRNAHYRLALLYKLQGMYEEAIKEYEKTIEIEAGAFGESEEGEKGPLGKELWLFFLFQIGLVIALL